MPLIKEIVPIEAERVTGFICDKCAQTFTDDLSVQEAHVFNFVGGFDSAWGDGTQVECVFCQHCLKGLIEPFARLTQVF